MNCTAITTGPLFRDTNFIQTRSNVIPRMQGCVEQPIYDIEAQAVERPEQ